MIHHNILSSCYYFFFIIQSFLLSLPDIAAESENSVVDSIELLVFSASSQLAKTLVKNGSVNAQTPAGINRVNMWHIANPLFLMYKYQLLQFSFHTFITAVRAEIISSSFLLKAVSKQKWYVNSAYLNSWKMRAKYRIRKKYVYISSRSRRNQQQRWRTSKMKNITLEAKIKVTITNGQRT